MGKRDIYQEIRKHDAMQFLYAAFFDDREDVYIKLGRSGTPYSRVKNIAVTCPFTLSRAVFSCVGSIKLAESIERSAKHQLEGYRLRGEWYRFARNEGRIFAVVIRNIYARTTGRALKWSALDTDSILKEITAAFIEKKNIAIADKAA